ncbi:MAG: M67 family metallopeptidase [Candidatus Bathyarchaeota archaeon]|nr:MAG: M67 family metallopeptidase [Candidatus Bathyarchaeota archaeon]
MKVKLKRQHIKSLKEEVQRVHPIEACGMLFGKMNPTEALVEKVVTAPNVLRSEKRFEIHPETVVKMILESEKEGQEFVGLFHSHSAPAYPSSIDIKFMKLWGDAIWLILATFDGKFAAFQMMDGKVKKAVLEIE